MSEPTNIVSLTEEQKQRIAAMKPASIPDAQGEGGPPASRNDSLTLSDATKHIAAIEQNMENYRGKKDVNPYAWLKANNIEKLKKRVAKGDVQAALEVLKIPKDAVPTLREFEYLEEGQADEQED